MFNLICNIETPFNLTTLGQYFLSPASPGSTNPVVGYIQKGSVFANILYLFVQKSGSLSVIYYSDNKLNSAYLNSIYKDIVTEL